MLFEDIATKWMVYAFSAWMGRSSYVGALNAPAIEGLIYRTKCHHAEYTLFALCVQAAADAANEWEMTKGE